MQSLVHFVWHTQHHWNLHLVHSMCMQPPSRSVGTRQLGQGFVDNRIALRVASPHWAAAARSSLTKYPAERYPPVEQSSAEADGFPSCLQEPICHPSRQRRQNTYCSKRLRLKNDRF
jgi:hypothetical protein